MSRRDELVAALVKVQAHRAALGKMRDAVQARADHQGDALAKDLHTVGAFAEADRGGVCTHRMVRTLLSDRDRLERVRAGTG